MADNVAPALLFKSEDGMYYGNEAFFRGIRDSLKMQNDVIGDQMRLATKYRKQRNVLGVSLVLIVFNAYLNTKRINGEVDRVNPTTYYGGKQ